MHAQLHGQSYHFPHRTTYAYFFNLPLAGFELSYSASNSNHLDPGWIDKGRIALKTSLAPLARVFGNKLARNKINTKKTARGSIVVVLVSLQEINVNLLRGDYDTSDKLKHSIDTLSAPSVQGESKKRN